jgi:predicted nucleic acid-binding protein
VILCDTGPIFAAADRKDTDHHACVDLFTALRLANRRLLVPQTVVAEVGYMLEAKIGTFRTGGRRVLTAGHRVAIALRQHHHRLQQ